MVIHSVTGPGCWRQSHRAGDGALTQPLFAWTMGPLLDRAILQRDPAVINWLPVGILGIFLLRGIAMFVAGYFMSRVGRRVVRNIIDQIFSHLLRSAGQLFSTPQQWRPAGPSHLLHRPTGQRRHAWHHGIDQETATVAGLLA
ncbi:MAG: ABC transporter transmembrane domain-containing protein [Thiolinea sp.]